MRKAPQRHGAVSDGLPRRGRPPRAEEGAPGQLPSAASLPHSFPRRSWEAWRKLATVWGELFLVTGSFVSGSRGQGAVATYSMRILCFHSSTSFTSSWDPPSGEAGGEEGLGLSLVRNLHLQHGTLAKGSKPGSTECRPRACQLTQTEVCRQNLKTKLSPGHYTTLS